MVLAVGLLWPLGGAPTAGAPSVPSPGGFGGPVESSRPVRPIERERATPTRFVLHRVPCAGPAGAETACFVAAS